MSDDLSQFLRRVAERRAGQQQPPQRQPSAPRHEIQYVDPQPIQAVEVVQAESVEPQLVSGIPDRTIGDHAEHLGEDVGLADEKMEDHLHNVFDHNLGRLHSSTAEEGKTAAERGAAQIFDMLRQPQSLRSAFILSEVFTRREIDW